MESLSETKMSNAEWGTSIYNINKDALKLEEYRGFIQLSTAQANLKWTRTSLVKFVSYKAW